MAKGPTPTENGDATGLLADGEAALWLTESIAIALLEAGVLSRDTILEAIESVVAAKQAEAEQEGQPEIARAAAARLASIASSLGAAAVPQTPDGHNRGQGGRGSK